VYLSLQPRIIIIRPSSGAIEEVIDKFVCWVV
jgi:hypothetical protein